MFKLSTKCSVSNILFRGAPAGAISSVQCAVSPPACTFYIFCWPEKHGDKFALSCLLVPLPPAYSAVHYSTHFLCLKTRERRPDLIMQISRARTHLSTRNSLSYVVSNKCEAVSWKAENWDRWRHLLPFQK